MKRILFLCSLIMCLFCFPAAAFAAEKTEESAKEAYEKAVASTEETLMENKIVLSELNASITGYRLVYKEAKLQGEAPEKAKELLKEIKALREEFQENNESMEPYREAKKACRQAKNADGAIAAMENMIRIQEYRIEKKTEINKLWKQVADLVK